MSHLQIKRNCVVCKEEFIAKSSKGIYCSIICFKRNWRKLQKENNVVIPKVKRIITKEDLLPKHYLSIKEAVVFFEISEVTLRRLIKENNLKYVCLKNRFLFLKSDLEGIT
ncbi:helix-turn-helix domain-containing protein [Flavobacterium taihuense]|uniref:helix-turn-helix domain-containing protein n=1 Tax=Flavobacterium taihuense TaxID=2857508 RepID=UPI001C5AF515|nr:helix-turn-helix domain-containing protein [Flavobacterium taihuense]